MSKNEDMLRQALAELAREETEQLEGSLSRTEIRRAEEMYQRHRRGAFALIRRVTGGHSPVLRYAAIAAAAAVLIGAAVLSLSHTPPDNVPAVQPPTVSVAPYYSPEPSPTAAPTEIPATPNPTEAPTEKWDITATPNPIIEETENTIATKEENTPNIPDIHPTFTEKPTETPAPAAPTNAPTPTPTEEPEKEEPSLTVPSEWQGSYFPYALPIGGTAVMTDGDGWRRMAWHAEGGEWVFAEYEENDVIDVPEDCAVSYIQWDGVIALRMEDDTGVTLAWVQDGHSFSLRTEAENAEAMAQSVRRIGE